MCVIWVCRFSGTLAQRHLPFLRLSSPADTMGTVFKYLLTSAT